MKLPSDLNIICATATGVWGQDAQEAVAVGELGELLTLFGRRAQGRDTPEQWVDEIADVLLMVHQLALFHGVEAVEARLQVKVEKLRVRLTMFGSTIPEQPARWDPAARLAEADRLLTQLLPIVQSANDGRPFPYPTRGEHLGQLYAYLEQVDERK